jgi:dTMP kinase
MSVTSLFVVFEGIDGSGKSTQIGRVADEIRRWNKYQDIVLTREPTWKARDIKQRLERERDAFSNGVPMAAGYIADRAEHWGEIRNDLELNRVVLCDRYVLSTLTYQSTQGVDVLQLANDHFRLGIGRPDITFYLALSPDEAERRIVARPEKREKFEEINFARRLVEQHECL